MFARPESQHHQIAYVTNDLDRAMAMFEQTYGAPGFFAFSNVESGAAGPGDPHLRVALTHIGGVEIELIEPIGDTAPLFKALLGNGPDLELRFHHIAIRIDGPIVNWEAHRTSLDFAEHPIVLEGGLGDDMRFLYTDERSRLGHFVEHVWMSPAVLEQIGAARPRYPAATAQP